VQAQGTVSDGVVNVYIGQEEFIHSTTHGQPIVQISRLEELHWTGLFQGARKP
jgi:cell wall-associated NlpC family hydrolase